MKKKEEGLVREILKLADKLGSKVTVSQEENLKITIDGDWTNGHPTKRPRK